MSPAIDLHLHTTYSDGASQPEELISVAIQEGLKAIAITDHDNTLSYPLACAAADGTGLEVIPGIEINTVWKNSEVHILGYYFEPEDPSLQALIEKHRESRIRQMEGIVQLLNTKARIKITMAEVSAHARTDGSLGRPHIAQTIVEKGGAVSIGDAFQKYLSPNAPTYLRRETVTPHEAVEAIYESGGIPVIAHPGDMVMIRELVEELMNYGLRGLEAYHRSHSPAMIEFHCSLAEKYGLIVTGGTDFHGQGDAYGATLNRLHMPEFVYDELQRERERLRKAAIKVS